MRKVLAASALATLCACAGGLTHGIESGGDGGLPIGGGKPDGGGASDAGDAGAADAGHAGTDAGCAALSMSSTGVIDGCFGGTSGTANVSVSSSTCSALITMTTATGSCTGTADGGHDAFTGACGGYPTCASASLPGTIDCGPCQITICDGGCP